MRYLDLPAGSSIRLLVTARADMSPHRWDVNIFASGAGDEVASLLSYGSQIGGLDRDQLIEVPTQDRDCRLEVTSRHRVSGGGWADDDCAQGDDTPTLVALGFSDPGSPTAHPDDVLLSFAFKSDAGSK